MNRVRSADGTTRNDELDTLVRSKTIDAALRKKVRCILGTTQDLEQNGDTGRLKGNTIDLEEEFSKVKHDVQVDVDISTARNRISGHRRRYEGVEVGLKQRDLRYRDVYCRIHRRVSMRCSSIVENC